MESLSLTWTFLLSTKSICVVGLTRSNVPVVLLRSQDGKNEVVLNLSDWQLLTARLQEIEEQLSRTSKKRKSPPTQDSDVAQIEDHVTRPNKRKKFHINDNDFKVVGTNFEASATDSTGLEVKYKADWLDILLERLPKSFILAPSEVHTLCHFATQINKAIEILSQQPTERIILTGQEEKFEELLEFLQPHT